MASPAEHAATAELTVVRKALGTSQAYKPEHPQAKAHAALDRVEAALVAQAEKADDTSVAHWRNEVMRCQHERDAAEARADQLQGELSETLELLTDVRTECRGLIEQRQEHRKRADQLQRERDEALQENESILQQVSEDYHYQRAERAEAALRTFRDSYDIWQSGCDEAHLDLAYDAACAALAGETSP